MVPDFSQVFMTANHTAKMIAWHLISERHQIFNLQQISQPSSFIQSVISHGHLIPSSTALQPSTNVSYSTWLQIFHRLSTFHKLLTAQISHIHKTFNIPYTFLISTDASQWPNFSPFTDATHWSDFSPFTDVTDRLFFHRHLSLPTSLFTLHQNAFPYLHKTTNNKVYPICNVSNLH